jgi:hypothetical protein
MALKSLLEGIAEDATAPIMKVGAALIVKATLSMLALTSAVAAAVFLTSAFHMLMEHLFGPLEALLAVGGLYLVITLAFALGFFLRERTSAREPADVTRFSGMAQSGIGEAPTAAAVPAAAARPASAPAESETARALDRFAAPVLDLLHEQGMERERLALAAGVAAAKELRPWMLVGLMAVVGVVVGRLARHPGSERDRRVM